MDARGRVTRIPWRLLALLSLGSLLLIGLDTIGFFYTPFFSYIYGVGTVGYSLTITLLCCRYSSKGTSHGGFRFAGWRSWRPFSPVLLGIGVLGFTCAQAALLLHFIAAGKEAPFPSIQHSLLYSMYPFFIWAILLLPAGNVSPLARLRIFLDSLIIIVAITAFCYYAVLGPLLVMGDGTLEEKVFGVIFPSADLVLLFCLLLVVLRSGASALRPVLLMLGLAVFFIFIIHISHLYEGLHGLSDWFSVVNVGWFPALILIVGAAQTLNNGSGKAEVTACPVSSSTGSTGAFFPTSRLKILFSPVLVLVLGLLVLAIWLSGVQDTFPGKIAIVYVGEFVILMLIVLRQLLAMCEIGVLQARLQKRNRSLRAVNALLEKLAITDSLTNLPNHRALVEKLDEILARAPVTNATCAVIFIDIDYFKAINDCYGHPVGDKVLCQLGGLIATNLRVIDYVGRWGGEEFVVIAPGMEPAQAFQMAERIRVMAEQYRFAGAKEVHLTCSLGVAAYPQDATERKSLIMSADRAMYTAKRLGRNQTRAAHESLVLAMGMLEQVPETTETAETLAVVEALIAALEERDPLTGEHMRRVAALSLKLALMMGLSRSEAYIVSIGGLLHDLGKVAMPDTVLFKRGKLSPAEVEYIARHPRAGADILAPVPSLQSVAAIVRSHHEWMDGSGYPDGLRGEEIPLGARIVSVADAYDAIISNRVYRQGRASTEALQELRQGIERQFDPRVVNALSHLLAAAPRLFGIPVA